jgi:hypothetical protein
MRPIRAVAVPVLLASLTALRADGPPAPKPTIEPLIERLADRDFRTREAAAKRIEALGPAELPALRKAKNHKDLEVRRRVAAWIPKLERDLLLAPKLVSLNLTDRPVREAVNALAKQTGYKIDLFQDAAREKQKFSFHFDRVPFWQALDRLCETSSTLLQPGYGDEIVRLSFQDRYVPYVFHRGAFRVVATGLNHDRNLQFESLPKGPAPGEQRFTENLRFNFNICSEPRLRLLSVGEAIITEATDDHKRSLVPPRGGTNNGMMHRAYYWGGHRAYTIGAQANLAPPSVGARVLKVLKGSIPVTLIAEQRALVVADKILAAKGKKATAGPVTFDIQDVRETPAKQYEVRMAMVHNGKKGEADHNWVNSLYGRVELQDDQGGKFMIFGSSMAMQNQASVQVTFTFGHANGGAGKPTKMIYYDWNTVQHEVPFAFKDLPLP